MYIFEYKLQVKNSKNEKVYLIVHKLHKNIEHYGKYFDPATYLRILFNYLCTHQIFPKITNESKISCRLKLHVYHKVASKSTSRLVKCPSS